MNVLPMAPITGRTQASRMSCSGSPLQCTHSHCLTHLTLLVRITERVVVAPSLHKQGLGS